MVTVFQGGRVITGSIEDRQVLDNGVVVVDGDSIVAVGSAGDTEIPNDVTNTIDVQGATILPGLFDMHTHVYHLCIYEYNPDLTDDFTIDFVAGAVIRALENGRRLIAAGITTIRDMGSRHGGIFAIRRAIENGDIVGPRILAAGAGIAMSGGHGYLALSEEADGVEEVRKLARKQLKLGADCIKVMASGGAGTPGEKITDTQYSVAEMAAAVDEAHKKGRTAAAHATCPQGVLNALDAGVDTIEHGIILDDASIQRLVDTGRHLVPTLEVYARIARSTEVPAYMMAKGKEAARYHKTSFQNAVAAGVKIVAGTDAGAKRWYLGDLVSELERMVEFGLEPIEAIHAATHNAAEAAQMLHQVGTLEVDKLADIIVVDGNPLSDINALRNVRFVMKEGAVQINDL